MSYVRAAVIRDSPVILINMAVCNSLPMVIITAHWSRYHAWANRIPRLTLTLTIEYCFLLSTDEYYMYRFIHGRASELDFVRHLCHLYIESSHK